MTESLVYVFPVVAYVAVGFVLLSAQLGITQSKQKLVPVKIRSRRS